MRFIADFHIHSHFSIATSKELVPEKLAYWASRKGITVVGTGDFTHPGWLEELRDTLKPAEHGLYALKDDHGLHASSDVRFLLTAEISSIYKKSGKVRKVHNLVFAPDFQTVELIQGKLSKIGNILSDGRPILGLDSRNLLELVLECSERCVFIPAHIWTPWFSALGAKSGFDTIDECYGDLSPHITAVETGLSSDPPMNWLCSFLDRFTVISNSDAHSPEKLGREANLFDTELSYDSIVSAMKQDGRGFQGTVEFFPQEGKYHYDGHRKCGVRVNPLESLELKGLCPKCGKKLTIGVLSRVAQLADRDEVAKREVRHNFHSVIPLKELVSQIQGTGVQSKRVTKAYEEIMGRCESELGLLIEYPLEEVKSVGGELLEEAVARMRAGSVYIDEGYDGEYGSIRVFGEGEVDARKQETSLFDTKTVLLHNSPTGMSDGFFSFDIGAYRALYRALYARSKEGQYSTASPEGETHGIIMELNEEQTHAVNHAHGPALVLAGPGTGKNTCTCGSNCPSCSTGCSCTFDSCRNLQQQGSPRDAEACYRDRW